MTTSPLIIAFVADLMFTTRIALVAEHLGYRVEWIESADQVGAPDAEAAPERPGEARRPVSYTHLDVYKRQSRCSPSNR